MIPSISRVAVSGLGRFFSTFLTLVHFTVLGVGLSCDASVRTIEFDLHAVSAAPDPDGFSFWELSGNPSAAEIEITPEADPYLASLVSELLRSQIDGSLDDLPGFLKNGIAKGVAPSEELSESIEKGIVVSGFQDLPEVEEEGQTMNLSIKISLPQLPPISSIEIYLVSSACTDFGPVFDSPAPLPGFILSEPTSLLESSKDYGLKISQSTEAVRKSMTSRAIFSPGDVEEFGTRNELPLAEAKMALTRQYEDLAVQYLTRLHDAKVVPGPRIQDKTARDKADEIHRQIQAQFADKVQVGYEGEVVRIFFPGFGLGEKAEISVPDDMEFQNKLEKRYLDFSRAGQKRRLLMDGTRLPSTMMIEADLIYLRRDPLVGTVGQRISGDRIQYECTPKPLSSSGVTIGAGVEFSPERKLTPLLGLQMPAANENESDLSFELSGGENSIAGKAEYLFPIQQFSGNKLWDSTQGVIRGGADDFTDAMYGNTNRGGLDSLETGISAGWIVRFDSYGHSDRFAATQPTREGLKGRMFRTIEAGFRYRDVDLDGRPVDLVGLDQGARSGPYLDARFLIGENMNIGKSNERLDSWWVEGRLAVDTSFRALGGSADYLRLLGELDVRRQWSFSDALSVHGTLGLSGAWVSGGTPTFDYFGAGQEEMLRGLRDTEFIGRSYVGVNADLGIDITSLLGGLAGDGSEGSSANDPKMLVLFGPFADAGWLFDRIENGKAVPGGKALQSFGVQLQMLQTSILNAPTMMSVGYAWSPQSEFDKSGSVFSRLSVSF